MIHLQVQPGHSLPRKLRGARKPPGPQRFLTSCLARNGHQRISDAMPLNGPKNTLGEPATAPSNCQHAVPARLLPRLSGGGDQLIVALARFDGLDGKRQRML